MTEGSSPVSESGVFPRDDGLKFLGERKVKGEGGCSRGVGGRWLVGGVRDGGTGRRREAEGCRRIDPDSEPE